MSLTSLVKTDFSWLPELAGGALKGGQAPDDRGGEISRKVASIREADREIKSRFAGLDVFVHSQADSQILFDLIDQAVDWSPFELVDLIKLDHDRAEGASNGVLQNEWLCRFELRGRYKDARPLIASLLDSIENVVPWTLAEKIFERDDHMRRKRKKANVAA